MTNLRKLAGADDPISGDLTLKNILKVQTIKLMNR